MLIPHVVSTEAEKVFVNVLNVQAVTVQAGDVVVWDVGTADGVRTTQPVTATLSLVVGVVDTDIAASSYGLVQNYGYRAAGALITNDTSVSVVAGDILIPVTATDRLARSAASDGKTGFIYAAETYVTNTTPVAALKKVFLRGL